MISDKLRVFGNFILVVGFVVCIFIWVEMNLLAGVVSFTSFLFFGFLLLGVGELIERVESVKYELKKQTKLLNKQSNNTI